MSSLMATTLVNITEVAGSCPVKEAPCNTIFISGYLKIKHWIQCHLDEVPVWKCSCCQFTATQHYDLRGHYLVNHNDNIEEGTDGFWENLETKWERSVSIVVPNANYIDPKPYKLSKKASQQVQSIIQKHLSSKLTKVWFKRTPLEKLRADILKYKAKYMKIPLDIKGAQAVTEAKNTNEFQKSSTSFKTEQSDNAELNCHKISDVKPPMLMSLHVRTPNAIKTESESSRIKTGKSYISLTPQFSDAMPIDEANFKTRPATSFSGSRLDYGQTATAEENRSEQSMNIKPKIKLEKYLAENYAPCMATFDGQSGTAGILAADNIPCSSTEYALPKDVASGNTNLMPFNNSLQNVGDACDPDLSDLRNAVEVIKRMKAPLVIDNIQLVLKKSLDLEMLAMAYRDKVLTRFNDAFQAEDDRDLRSILLVAVEKVELLRNETLTSSINVAKS